MHNTTRMRPVVSSLFVTYLTVSVAAANPAKTAEPIEIQFGLWTRASIRNRVWWRRITGDISEGHTGTRLTVDILKVIHVVQLGGPCASSCFRAVASADSCRLSSAR